MVITNETTLPTEEELTVPEINLSSAALRAGAFHLGKHCEKENLVSFASIRYHSQMNKSSTTFIYLFRISISCSFTFQNQVVM